MLARQAISTRSMRGLQRRAEFGSAKPLHGCSSRTASRRFVRARTPNSIRTPATASAVPTITTQDAAAEAAAEVAPNGPQEFAWERNWWPVHVVSYLDPSRPTPVELLGMQLVLWRDGSGAWRCFRDSCPHRRVPLSEGRVEGGELVCSYHGWRFDQGGACTAIPQAPDAKSLAAATASPRSCATAFPTQEAAGLLWVWPDSGPTAAADAAAVEPPLPNAVQQEVFGPRLVSGWFMRQMPFDFDVLLENVADPSHVPFSHHGTFPNVSRYKAIPQPFQPPAGPLEATTDSDLLPSGKAPTAAFNYPSPGRPLNRILLYAPGLVTLTVPGQLINLIYVVPSGPGRSTYISGAAFAPPPAHMQTPLTRVLSKLMAATPKHMQHIAQLRFVDGDTIFLNMQGHFLRSLEAKNCRVGDQGRPGNGPWAKEYFTPMTSDGAIVAARKWIDRVGGGGPAYPADATPATPLMSREQVLDRMGQHTKHCTHCRQALTTADRLATVGKVLLAAAFFALCCLAATQGLPKLLAGGLPSVGTAAAVFGALVALRLRSAGERLRQQLTFVDYVHADIP